MAEAAEIEITPQMIEAGVWVYRLECADAEPLSGGAELVADIFEAMIAVSKSQR